MSTPHRTVINKTNITFLYSFNLYVLQAVGRLMHTVNSVQMACQSLQGCKTVGCCSHAETLLCQCCSGSIHTTYKHQQQKIQNCIAYKVFSSCCCFVACRIVLNECCVWQAERTFSITRVHKETTLKEQFPSHGLIRKLHQKNIYQHMIHRNSFTSLFPTGTARRTLCNSNA